MVSTNTNLLVFHLNPGNKDIVSEQGSCCLTISNLGPLVFREMVCHKMVQSIGRLRQLLSRNVAEPGRKSASNRFAFLELKIESKFSIL